MKRKLIALAFVGMLLGAGTLIVAAGEGPGIEKTMLRFERIIGNAEKIADDLEQNNSNVSELREIIADMEFTKNKLSYIKTRREQLPIIEEFTDLMASYKVTVHDLVPGHRAPLRKIE